MWLLQGILQAMADGPEPPRHHRPPGFSSVSVVGMAASSPCSSPCRMAESFRDDGEHRGGRHRDRDALRLDSG
jgi:hypothetical protein